MRIVVETNQVRGGWSPLDPEGWAATARTGSFDDEWALLEKHRAILKERHGVDDLDWSTMPVHEPCERCC